MVSDKAAPLYLSVEAKKDAYLWHSDIADMVCQQKVSRIVRYSGELRSAQMTGGGWLKPIQAFDIKHSGQEDTFRAFLEECEEKAGQRMPSSYNGLFRAMFHAPRIPFSINAGLSPFLAGAWEEARHVGYASGFHRQYDINGAYRWAARQGLPDPETFRATDRVSVNRPGVYVLYLTGKENVPYPYSQPGWAVVTDMEIEAYNLTWTAYRFGVTWSNYWHKDAVDRVLDSVSFGPQMAKNFWGSWAARMPVENVYPKKGSVVLQHPMSLNLVWAHRVISLVKLHVWEKACNACHVYCDSIITTDTMPTSVEIGGWKLVQEFPNGLYVGGAGVYGLSPDNLLKHVGTPNVRHSRVDN